MNLCNVYKANPVSSLRRDVLYSLYQWWARHQGSAAVRSPLSVRRQQPASAPCRQINSSQNIITYHTQVFSELRATCPHREDRDRPVGLHVCVECVKTISSVGSTKGVRF